MSPEGEGWDRLIKPGVALQTPRRARCKGAHRRVGPQAPLHAAAAALGPVSRAGAGRGRPRLATSATRRMSPSIFHERVARQARQAPPGFMLRVRPEPRSATLPASDWTGPVDPFPAACGLAGTQDSNATPTPCLSDDAVTTYRPRAPRAGALKGESRGRHKSEVHSAHRGQRGLRAQTNGISNQGSLGTAIGRLTQRARDSSFCSSHPVSV